MIYKVLGEVVTIIGAGRWLDPMVVVDQLRMELISLSIEKTIEAIEASL